MRATAYQVFNKTLAAAGVAEDLVVIDHNLMGSAWKITIVTDKAVYILIDKEETPTEANSLELDEGDSYSDDNISITRGLRFLNVTTGETPHVRGILWGG